MVYCLHSEEGYVDFPFYKKQEMKKDHTGRGVSGALYLQSAKAGVVSFSEGWIRTVCTDFDIR